MGVRFFPVCYANKVYLEFDYNISQVIKCKLLIKQFMDSVYSLQTEVTEKRENTREVGTDCITYQHNDKKISCLISLKTKCEQ